MKQALIAALITLLLLAPTLTAAQQSSTDTQPNGLQWTATYPRPPTTLYGAWANHGDIASCFVQTSDGGYLIAGNTQDHVYLGPHGQWGNTHSALLIKTDSEGNMQWQKENESFAYTVAITETRHIGYTIITSRGLLLKVDYQGNITSLVNNIPTSDAYPLPNGGYLVAGINSDANRVATFNKTDKDGNLLWNNTLYVFPNDYSDGIYLSNIAPASNGSYFIAARAAGYINIAGTMSPNLWLLKIDSNGSLINSESYYFNASNPTIGPSIESGNPPIISGIHIVASKDGGFLLVGTADYYSWWMPFFIKIDSEGNWEWVRSYKEIGQTAGFISAIQVRDYGYVVVGGFSSRFSNGQGFLLKTDENGNLKWNQTFPIQAQGRASAIIATSDGGYAVLGRQLSLGPLGTEDDVIWLAKFAPILPPATPTPTPSPKPETSNAVIPIAAAVAVAVLCIVGVLVLLNKRRR